jgi:competence protein ComEC
MSQASRLRRLPALEDQPEQRGAPWATSPDRGADVGSAPAQRADRPDLRLVLPGAFGWAVGWLAPVIGAGRAIGLGAGLAGIGVLALCRSRFVSGGTVAAVCVAGAAIAVAAAARIATVQDGPLRELARERQTATLELVITGDPARVHPRQDGPVSSRPTVLVPARAELLRRGDGQTRLRLPVLILAPATDRWAGLVPGQRIRTTGRLAPPRRLDGTAAVFSPRGPPTVTSAESAVQSVASGMRADLRQAVAGLDPAARGLIPALAVGDTTQMPDDLVKDFRRSGLSHLTAVSGANLAIVAGVVIGVVRGLGRSRRTAGTIGLVAVVGFVVLARPQPSVLRAAVMAVILLAALVTGRRRAGLAALAGSVLVLLLIDPWLARSYGFALSVLATAGMLVLAPGWRDRIAARLPGPVLCRAALAEAVALSAAAQVATLPVVVMLSGQISLVSLVANLVAAPAVPATTILGLSAALLGQASHPVAAVVGTLAGWPADWIVRIARTSADLPGAVVPWRSGLTGGLLVLAAVVAAITVGPMLVRRRLATGSVVGGCVLVLGGAHLLGPAGWPPPGWVAVACDVGQGDALAVPLGQGSAVVVDAGPDPSAVDACLERLRVHRVPLLVLTHFHADHVDGLPGVLSGRAVGEILVSPLAEPAAGSAEVQRLAAAAGVPVRVGGAGQVRAFGSSRFEVVWPRPAGTGWPAPVDAGDPAGGGSSEGSGPNNASLVLLATVNGVRILLTGDIEPPAQDALLSGGANLRADVLKVPHHGSSYQDERLPATVHPAIALISVGAGNDYGHPSARTIAALRSVGARVLRTDHDGDLAVALAGGRLRAATRGSWLDRTVRVAANRAPLARSAATEWSAVRASDSLPTGRRPPQRLAHRAHARARTSTVRWLRGALAAAAARRRCNGSGFADLHGGLLRRRGRAPPVPDDPGYGRGAGGRARGQRRDLPHGRGSRRHHRVRPDRADPRPGRARAGRCRPRRAADPVPAGRPGCLADLEPADHVR